MALLASGKQKKILLGGAIGLCAVILAVLGGIYFGKVLPERREYEKNLKFLKDYYDSKVAAFEEENAGITPGEYDVVFLGDSLTDGCDLSRYYPEYKALNRGIGGDTSFGLAARMQVSLYDVAPRAAVMLIGGNNLDTVSENYGQIVKEMRDTLPDTKIVLVSLSAMGRDWARNNEKAVKNNELIRAVAEREGCSFVDIFTPLYDEAAGEIYEEYTVEGVHFTEAGYAVVTERIRAELSKIL